MQSIVGIAAQFTVMMTERSPRANSRDPAMKRETINGRIAPGCLVG